MTTFIIFLVLGFWSAWGIAKSSKSEKALSDKGVPGWSNLIRKQEVGAVRIEGPSMWIMHLLFAFLIGGSKVFAGFSNLFYGILNRIGKLLS